MIKYTIRTLRASSRSKKLKIQIFLLRVVSVQITLILMSQTPIFYAETNSQQLYFSFCVSTLRFNVKKIQSNNFLIWLIFWVIYLLPHNFCHHESWFSFIKKWLYLSAASQEFCRMKKQSQRPELYFTSIFTIFEINYSRMKYQNSLVYLIDS